MQQLGGALVVALVVTTACESRDAKIKQLTERRAVLIKDLHELPGYRDARGTAAGAGVLRTNTLSAAIMDAARRVELDDDLAQGPDGSLLRFCVAIGKTVDENPNARVMQDAPPQPEQPAVHELLGSDGFRAKCLEIWRTEDSRRAILKG